MTTQEEHNTWIAADVIDFNCSCKAGGPIKYIYKYSGWRSRIEARCDRCAGRGQKTDVKEYVINFEELQYIRKERNSRYNTLKKARETRSKNLIDKCLAEYYSNLNENVELQEFHTEDSVVNEMHENNHSKPALSFSSSQDVPVTEDSDFAPFIPKNSDDMVMEVSGPDRKESGNIPITIIRNIIVFMGLDAWKVLMISHDWRDALLYHSKNWEISKEFYWNVVYNSRFHSPNIPINSYDYFHEKFFICLSNAAERFHKARFKEPYKITEEMEETIANATKEKNKMAFRDDFVSVFFKQNMVFNKSPVINEMMLETALFQVYRSIAAISAKSREIETEDVIKDRLVHWRRYLGRFEQYMRKDIVQFLV
jgi:hypothetical protein